MDQNKNACLFKARGDDADDDVSLTYDVVSTDSDSDEEKKTLLKIKHRKKFGYSQ